MKKSARVEQLTDELQNSPAIPVRGTQGSTRILSTVVAGIFLACAGPQAAAESATDKEPLELRRIMQDLGKNMQSVTDAISHEDWARVAKIAPEIAEHRQPPITEKVRILAFIGTDVARFKEHDGKTHHAARDMAGAAARNDGTGVIAAFAKLQASCLACHQEFRKSFVEHFYE